MDATFEFFCFVMGDSQVFLNPLNLAQIPYVIGGQTAQPIAQGGHQKAGDGIVTGYDGAR